jgi:hypothetical protein
MSTLGLKIGHHKILAPVMITPKFQPSPTIAEPFLWVHIALLLGLPWLLGLCLQGLAVGDPLFPSGLEILLLAIPAITLPVWWQWHKPLSPFSIWVAAKPINELTPSQLKILALLKDAATTPQSELTPKQIFNLIKQYKFAELAQSIEISWNPTGWVAIASALLLYSIFRHLYQIAPLAADFAPFPPVLRLLGLVWAFVFLSLSSLILQMGISAARLLLVSPTLYQQTAPLEASQVKSNFTSFGMRLAKFFEFTITESHTTISKTKTASGWLSFELNENNPIFKLWLKLTDLFSKEPIKTTATREELQTDIKTTDTVALDPKTEEKQGNPNPITSIAEANDRSAIIEDRDTAAIDREPEELKTEAEALNNNAEAKSQNPETNVAIAEVNEVVPIVYEEPTVVYEEPKAANEDPTALDEQLTAVDEQPAAGNEELTAVDNESTVENEESKAAAEQLTEVTDINTASTSEQLEEISSISAELPSNQLAESDREQNPEIENNQQNEEWV